MRIHFDGLVRPKLVAKSLMKALSRGGLELALARCQAVTARMFGYADWHDLVRNHAAGPASPDDGDSGLAVAAERRLQYGRVLSELGIDPLTIPEVLDAVRPTDRSRPAAPKGPSFPQFLIEAIETDGSGNRMRSLGMQDLTWQVVSDMVRSGGSRGRDVVRDMEIPPRMITIHMALSDAARVAGFEGRLALPGFKQTLEAFLDQVGPRENLPEFKQRMDEISRIRSRIKSAATELAEVRTARFTTRYSDYGQFNASHGSINREFVSDPSDAYGDWGWDDYVSRNPRPDWQNEEGLAAWNKAYAAWVRTDAPPWVFGTILDKWKGVEASEIREYAEDGANPFNIDDIIDNSLSEHHEDANDYVVDVDVIHRIVADWWPHAGSGSPEDLALEASVAEWNGRQEIESYGVDARVILPVRPGLTQADAVAWCERRHRELEGKLDALMQWAPDPVAAGQEPQFQPAA